MKSAYLRTSFVLGFSLLLASLSGCGVIKKKDSTEQSNIQALTDKPIPPEKAQEVIGEVADGWFYGEGIGEAALTVGTVVVFPPYLAVVIGNAALSVAGYEPVTVSGLLPPEEGESWSNTYSTIVSGPGRLTSAVAGRDFKTKEDVEREIKEILSEDDNKVSENPIKIE